MTDAWYTLRELATLGCLIGGLFFMLVGTIGLWRFGDIYNRMHAATKCLTLGLVGLLLAIGLQQGSYGWWVIVSLGLVIVFQFVAAPVAAHMLSRAAHLSGSAVSDAPDRDELAIDRAQAESSQTGYNRPHA